MDANGKPIIDAADPYGYKGQYGYYNEPSIGLILCTNRYYDSSVGRWLTRDPVGYSGGLNLYAYCMNDPINGVDPSGNCPGGGFVGPVDTRISNGTNWNSKTNWNDYTYTIGGINAMGVGLSAYANIMMLSQTGYSRMSPAQFSKVPWNSYVKGTMCYANELKAANSFAEGTRIFGKACIWTSVALAVADTSINTTNNIQEHRSNVKIRHDIEMDAITNGLEIGVPIAITSIGAAMTAGAIAGSVVPGVGTVIGATAAAVGFWLVFDVWKDNSGRTVHQRMRDAVQ